MVSGRALAACISLLLGVMVGWWPTSDAVARDSRDRRIEQFYHTAWTVREGAPGQVTALAQTADGYLWLGTQTGLYRFDGVRFERYRPREGGDFLASSVASLYAPPSGGLWVGFRYGVASFIDHDRATHYAAGSGLPTATIYAMASTPDGRVWAATFNGLVTLAGNRWRVVGPAMGLPGVRARNLAVDSAGRLWVATEQALAWLAPGAQRFEVATRSVGRINRIAEAPDGSIWVAEADDGVRPAWNGGRDPALSGPKLHMSSAGLLFDRDGALWVPTLGEGIRRVPHIDWLASQTIEADSAAAERFVERNGLSSDYFSAVIQDREGNIWMGGSRGLDRFRRGRLLPAPLSPGATDFALVPAPGHGVWVGTKNRPLTHVDATNITGTAFPEAITAAARDGDATWLGGPRGLWHMVDGVPRPFASLPADDYTGVQAIVGDGHGGAWLSINRPGIYHYTGEGWIHDTLPSVSNDPSPLVLLRDARQRLWMGFARNVLIVRDGGRDKVIGAADGLQVGNVTALLDDDDTVWVGGELGIAAIRGGSVRSIPTAGEPLRGVSGLVRDRRGDFWMNAAQGVARIASADMRQALDEPGYRPPVMLFDSLDGLPGTPAQFRPLPTAVVADDGRLWFATTSGVVSIDPSAIRRNPVAPPVMVREISTDAGTWSASSSVTLPANTERLRIAYTATSLSMPERVRFRYRMDGLDTRWREAGTDREAVYTDPPPGHYVFRVTASNEDGVWNEQGTSIAVTVSPAFYQTLWFALVCTVALLLAIWIALLLRGRRVAALVRGRLDERHAERERIARELHDTLLQSIHGLTMRFQAIANRVAPDDPVRTAMEGALDRAEEALVEARDRVRDLRAHGTDDMPLNDVLEAMARLYASDHTVPVIVSVRLDVLDLDPLARDELHGIAREAVHNAVTHAGASRIDVVLEEDDGMLLFYVRDDGRGIEDAVSRDGRAGHWGLRGIRERAHAMGGIATIAACLQGGTEVAVRVPMDRAFPSRMSWLRRWWRRFPERHY
ncbi:sensor histidine kinase [Luteibacter sp. 9133]|uniref:sensor histidine kinase n=1 Tax=Luteibacter sp. 9133 TaxID=1500891 RepID=UPI0005BD79E8|nr:sensor histidine kinase [Luteibacter sp. 9133]